ncbi:hypothetical protein CRUP_029628, partial [Coryphaenoides rupestris]
MVDARTTPKMTQQMMIMIFFCRAGQEVAGEAWRRCDSLISSCLWMRSLQRSRGELQTPGPRCGDPSLRLACLHAAGTSRGPN